MYKAKLINNGVPEDFEAELNNFLESLEDGQLIDVKYSFQVVEDKYGSDAFSALVIYK